MTQTQTAFQEQKEKLAARKEEEEEIRKGPRPVEDPRAADLPYGEGRVDAAIFNGVHVNQNNNRPSVDTGHRLHASTLAAQSEEAKNEPAPAPVTSQGALAQDLEAAKLTAPAESIDPVEVPKKNLPEAADGPPLSRPSPAGTGAKNEKARGGG